ncbi:Branched-chain amino acid transport system 2 carrier protein [Vibrio owensii]|uniref:Branched-chain amino acid transport system carrier protein n=1 Tax=Vibrio jasicida TaxID=766224 RepID=A0AAU9QUA8_9VIBR|nr:MULTISPECIES: branched-chain amino acid transport system II carrier protein [Vibrio]CAH1521775.1 Branched-chain amino acid transport system 2 carrier protein [Vibrio owensii]CAH1542899.1 Branched-chain amino acid transport system 2 carrier protein [Vibrio jasicida]CAH1552178.1 Branched-chain amino acid transport system 2 carrier protein [Vibrio owensii]CAH1599395.1 Branched-chain amino acid transport system 2 carrier protein [Vibrio jasicida]CAH1602107.1 Branched-chain amino acid transport 
MRRKIYRLNHRYSFYLGIQKVVDAYTTFINSEKGLSVKQTLKLTDIIAVGFMLFAFFLGAGNIIFPPLAGQLAGDHLMPAMFGFLLTAVGLPLITIVAIAVAGGSWDHLTQDLPKKAAVLMAALIFIIIGPAFAAPRTGLVAYEMAIKPFFVDATQAHLTSFSILFFAVAMLFAWFQGRLIDLIGKVLTPVLFLGLIVLAIAVFVDPQGEMMGAHGEYLTQPLTKGFLEGYNTMDTFASLMFGMLMVDALRSKGITERAATTKYLICAGCIAAAGLAFVYISLFYLGATSATIAAGADNGGAVLSQYVQALFGPYGQIVLSIIVLLACLTTAIGLISACSDFFSSKTKLTYKQWVIINGAACALIANVGLSQLISLSVPVLFALYPVAVALVALTFVRSKLPNPRVAYRSVLLVSLLFALIDAAKVAGLDVSAFNMLPLFEVGMGWVLPTFAAIVCMFFVAKSSQPELTEEAA